MDRDRQLSAHLKVAGANLRAGNYAEARRWYRRVLEVDPTNVQALQGLDAAERRRWLRRWVLPVGGLLVVVLVVVAALTVGYDRLFSRPAEPLFGSRVASGQGKLVPAGQTPAPSFPWLPALPADPQESVRAALRELEHALRTDNLGHLTLTAQSLTLAQQTWDSQTPDTGDWISAAARVGAALESAQARRWAVAAEHLAAAPRLPGEAQQDLSVSRFLILLRAGEADLARYMGSLFSRPEYLRAAHAHFSLAREVSEGLPSAGDWAERLARTPLWFFDDFDTADLAGNWAGAPAAEGLLDEAGNLQWGGEGVAGPLFSRAGGGWRDYALVARLRPGAEGRVGLGLRCGGDQACCVAWLPVGPEQPADGGAAPPWWVECREAGASRTYRPRPAVGTDGGACRLSPEAWHVVAVTVAGDQIALTCNGVASGLARGVEGPAEGGIGLFAQEATVWFDYVAVTDPPALPRD